MKKNAVWYGLHYGLIAVAALYVVPKFLMPGMPVVNVIIAAVVLGVADTVIHKLVGD